uniref:AlNc14C33G3034 protein n=1 Tax=Albugo laibachii Nc14 TaxID=890382 RepID=F0W874_9STRA|nr:AlNc14C33G3034 [Albugo laibachii Nc14]|eukprot:CCA17358.1 AlNc14C33G3034 [Albugo laibachii Nc14]
MRKEQKIVAGFVGTLVGVIGVLHVYVPFYSNVGQQAKERAGIKAGYNSDDKDKNHSTISPSNSMWTNMKAHELHAKHDALDELEHSPNPSQDA